MTKRIRNKAFQTNDAPSNVVYHTAFGHPAKKREPTSVGQQGVIHGKYCYPKSMLVQEYFCRYGDGTWGKPIFRLRMLGCEEFKSPLGALLNQLESEGHDVKGARVEWLAFRDLAKRYNDLFLELGTGGYESTVADHLFDAPARRKP